VQVLVLALIPTLVIAMVLVLVRQEGESLGVVFALR
jgi:hypothetical protein